MIVQWLITELRLPDSHCPQENENSQQIKVLQEGISRLQKDLDSAKNLIQQILVQRRMADVGLDEAKNEKEWFREPYDFSCNTDVKQTCFVTKIKTKE